jgi:hypothetical protein
MLEGGIFVVGTGMSERQAACAVAEFFYDNNSAFIQCTS